MASHGLKSGLKAEVSEERHEYVTPSNYELEKLLARGTVAYTHVNEVWPNVFIGDECRDFNWNRPLNRNSDPESQEIPTNPKLKTQKGGTIISLTNSTVQMELYQAFYFWNVDILKKRCFLDVAQPIVFSVENVDIVVLRKQQTARDRYGLQKLGVTHVLNAAEGERNSVCTGAGYYSNMDMEYYGIEAEDIPSFNISVHFFTMAEYMRRVLSNAQNKLLVHCVMGRSRSATLVLAYLMIEEKMTLVEAIEQVKHRRQIIPNWGFLKQLRELDTFLLEQRSERSHTQAADNTERTNQ